MKILNKLRSSVSTHAVTCSLSLFSEGKILRALPAYDPVINKPTLNVVRQTSIFYTETASGDICLKNVPDAPSRNPPSSRHHPLFVFRGLFSPGGGLVGTALGDAVTGGGPFGGGLAGAAAALA